MNSFINFIHNNIEYVQIFNNYAPYIVAIEFIGLILYHIYQFRNS